MALEDEFKDRQLNLPVLKVIAHAIMYYALLDKYKDNLELGKNGSAFIQGEMPEKMKDPGLFTLPCKLENYRRLKLLDDFYVMDMEKDPATPLVIGREFLGDVPINLKGNMWESEELIKKKKIDWNKPPKEGDGAWHIRIKLIDPDEEKFKKTFQSIPTIRKLFEKENPSEIIDLDYFHDL
nr:hypothetical protein [Tanacetum cinerariifolium]